jgi:hypothetical protein
MKSDNVYNESEDACVQASAALLERSRDIIMGPLADAIWRNLGFHVAHIRLTEAGMHVPTGPELQALIALVLAAEESARGQMLLESAVGEP